MFNRVETEAGEVYASTDPATPLPWNSTAYPESMGAEKTVASGAAYSVSAHSIGNVRAVFLWQANGPNDNPPEDGILYVKVNAMTYVPASIQYGNPAGALSGLVVNNGFGKAPTNSNYGTQYSYISQGLHLVQVKTNGQTEVKTPFAEMNGQVTISGTADNGGSASAGAYLSYSAQKDERGVRITRGGAPSPKLENDPTLNQSRDEWIEADGTGHGHSVYSYTDKNYLAGGPGQGTSPSTVFVPNIQTFGANHAGTWSWLSTYQWTPMEDGSGALASDTVTTHQQEMPYGTFNKEFDEWVGTASGMTSKIITYQITDASDGATAKARYYLTLHDPWQILTHISVPAKRNYRPHPHGAWTEASEDGDTLTGQVTQDYGWDVGVTFSSPDKAIAKLIGVDVSVTRTASSGVAVGNEHNNVRAGYRARVMIWDAVISHTGIAEQWDVSAYVGISPFQYDVPENPTAGGMQLGLLEWGGAGPEPIEGPFVG